MLFLSPGIVYWVQKLLHWCDSNTVFIVDVSRVYAISSTEDGKKQHQSVHTHSISEHFQTGTRKKDKKYLKIGCQHFNDLPVSTYLWLNTDHLQNFRSDGLSQDISCMEMINQ